MMKIEYLHASKFGNGVMVAEEFCTQMAARGVTVEVHHIREAKPKKLPSAALSITRVRVTPPPYRRGRITVTGQRA